MGGEEEACGLSCGDWRQQLYARGVTHIYIIRRASKASDGKKAPPQAGLRKGGKI